MDMSIYDVVVKLVGPVTPIGESKADAERLKNLDVMTDLIDKLLAQVEVAATSATRQEASMKKIGETAAEFVEAVRQSLTA